MSIGCRQLFVSNFLQVLDLRCCSCLVTSNFGATVEKCAFQIMLHVTSHSANFMKLANGIVDLNGFAFDKWVITLKILRAAFPCTSGIYLNSDLNFCIRVGQNWSCVRIVN